MSEYLLINILIIIIPLLLSFEKKLKFYKNIIAVVFSIVVVGSLYIAWDVIAANRGDWSFNSKYVSGIKIINLPIEEILFFITVPYACIFIYETGRYYLGDNNVKLNSNIIILSAAALFIAAFIFNSQNYTFTVLVLTGMFLLISNYFYKRLLESKLYWFFIAFCFIPFAVVNYFLTSLPVVTYNENTVWGIRISTIPLEDFFYSFSMISFFILVYLLVKEKWLIKRK